MNKKFVAILLICLAMLNLTNVVFASNENSATKISQQKDNGEKIREEDYKKLFEKYDVEVLSEDEVRSLNLNDLNNNVLNSSMSLKELEKLMIEHQQLEPIIQENKVYLNTDKDIKDTKELGLFSSYLTRTIDKIIRETKTYSEKSFPYDVPAIVSAAATYEYRYVKYPVGPPEITNKRFISCSDGGVSIEASTSMVPYTYKIDSVEYSSCEIVTDTKLKHRCDYTAGFYVGVPVPNTPLTHWVRIGDGTPVSVTNYYLLD